MAMRFIQDKKLEGRTFGVFSKCDQTSCRDVLRALVLNEPCDDGETAEVLGRVALRSWVTCMLKAPNEKHLQTHNFERLFLQSQREQEFFEHGGPDLKCLVEKECAGIPCLVRNLEEAYSNYLHSTWKAGAMGKVLQKLEDKEVEFTELGVVEETEAKNQLAKQEVEKRFSDDGPDAPVKQLYLEFRETILKSMRQRAQEVLMRLTNGEVDACSQGERLNQIREALKTELLAPVQRVSEHFLDHLKSILEAEIPLEKEPSIAAAAGSYCMQTCQYVRRRYFGKSAPQKQELRRILKGTPFIQLCRYKAFTDAVMQKCKNLFEEQEDLMKKKAVWLASRFTDVDSPWLHCTATSIACPDERMKEFIERAEAMFLRLLPTPSQLKKLPDNLDVGVATEEFQKKADSLKDELKKIKLARDGIKRALFTEEEFGQFVSSFQTERSG
ncbi:Hypothetical protein (Fragment) [Durusdinium trenchii]